MPRGRRPYFDRPVSQRIWIKVTPSQRAALVEMAKANRTTVAAAIREAVNEYVSDYGERPVFRGDPNSAATGA